MDMLASSLLTDESGNTRRLNHSSSILLLSVVEPGLNLRFFIWLWNLHFSHDSLPGTWGRREEAQQSHCPCLTRRWPSKKSRLFFILPRMTCHWFWMDPRALLPTSTWEITKGQGHRCYICKDISLSAGKSRIIKDYYKASSTAGLMCVPSSRWNPNEMGICLVLPFAIV